LLKRSDDERDLSAAKTMIQMAEAAFGDYGPLGASFRRSFYLRWRPQYTSELLDVNDAAVLDRIGKIGFDYTAAAHDIDVSSEARQVSCPALIFHARGDTFIPFEEGRLLAALIPNARLVAFACANHQPLESDPEWPAVVDELQNFLAPGSARASAFRLTARQIEVLRFIGQGQTDKQIARAIGLSHRTVEMHVGRVLQALNCSTRAEAVRIAAEQFLLG
jgi:DNA-binding CsgD family transcriptional regulator